MARSALFILILTLFVSHTALWSATVDEAVTRAVEKGQSELALIVTFRDQQDMSVLSAPASSRQQRLEALRENARLSQCTFCTRFSLRAERLRTFWIANAVALTVPSTLVADLASHENVETILLDDMVQLPPVTVTEGHAKGEWTYGLEKLRIPALRAQFGLLGDGVTVGVIDTGVDPAHPDLENKVIGFKDLVNNRPAAYDDQGHGTHCCGTIAGGNAGGTAIGVAPNAKLIVAKAFSSSGSAQSSWLLGAMQFMADPDENPATNDAPSIVSNSWGGGAGNTTYLEATKNWLSLGIFPSFAAGNSGPGAGTVGTPGGFLESFAVGATDSSDGIAYFSSRGPVTWDGVKHVKPDVSAPGKDVYSAKPGGGYTKMSGTSMACPHVSGLIALIHQASPGISVNDVRELLENTADELGDEGKDNTFGAGRVNALAAIEIAVSGGRLLGSLKDADTGAPIAGTVNILEKDMTLKTNATTGAFLTTLPEGTYTLTASAFGYRDGEAQQVTLVASQETEVALSLTKAATGTIVGTVKGKDTGVLVAATVRVLETPLAAIDVPNGNFSTSLPGGSYQLLVTAFGYASQTTEMIAVAEQGEVHVEILLDPLPPVLVVDDDKGKPYETYYTAILDELSVAHDVIDVKQSGQLELMDILGYEILVWFTGDDYSTTLTEGDRDILARYLESGGRLILSGQDVAYDLKNDAFLGEYLKTSFVKDDAGTRNVRGQGLSFSIDGGANNQKYPDLIEAKTGATVFLEYADKGTAAVLVDDLPGKVLYMAFGIEGISSAEQRKELLERVLAAVAPTAEDAVARLLLLDDESHRLRWAELVEARLSTLTTEELHRLDLRLGGRLRSPAVRSLLRTVRGQLHQR